MGFHAPRNDVEGDTDRARRPHTRHFTAFATPDELGVVKLWVVAREPRRKLLQLRRRSGRKRSDFPGVPPRCCWEGHSTVPLHDVAVEEVTGDDLVEGWAG